MNVKLTTATISVPVLGVRTEGTTDKRLIDSGSTSVEATYSISENTASASELGMQIMSREDLRQSLRDFEKKYDISSEEFYELWQNGSSPIEGIDKLRWAAFWEAWIGQYMAR